MIASDRTAAPPDGGTPATHIVLPGETGQRLDQFLLDKYPDLSRSSLHQRIAAADVLGDVRPG